jgi:hypothetical protein
MKSDDPSPARSTIETVCAWCAKETGEVSGPEVSHGICPRHWCAEMLVGGMPAQTVRDRAARLFGMPEAEAAFDAAAKLIVRDVAIFFESRSKRNTGTPNMDSVAPLDAGKEGCSTNAGFTPLTQEAMP